MGNSQHFILTQLCSSGEDDHPGGRAGLQSLLACVRSHTSFSDRRGVGDRQATQSQALVCFVGYYLIFSLDQ